MKIDYKITEYFKENNLFDNESSFGLIVKNNFNSLLINGTSKDLVELADILCSLALSKNKNDHIHIDDLSLLNKISDYSEIIIEKKEG